ncbi:ABC transporter substrate-binding protein [Marine Group I thaumarchaeote]|uniref:ABC transporter substrate-binding protein n=1 Tax=Marine Group I thaumarchaeote TaxID=2511932 RepID=A0A7K4P611_9ARCH|nr:MAG: ABC transporter substrate-binding protein [Nitrosopumilus sp. YT1]NMI81557.1 ABC transporter substrate-binding protein [Candidatus Nitrosopumilus sp. MTA1]NWJ19488.1 ABC transporter substrate-binding protein [Marine Group I thaumarchaeote]NWJ56939.1 ABC transporter substrate-binding protein [Marine Group I thaumarchaeote]NWJ83945.1 ABC transporter substrate-binding protein [Marine Group I thaumarchaeote]
MKKLLVLILALSIAVIMYNESFAEKSTFFDSVKFIQYLDENTALEEVRNGNLDVYYYTISSDRLENYQAREGLQVFDSTGGSYSILVNPAESEEFNPFSSKDIRFALNYLIDRKLIVNELMGGYGSPIISYYGPSDPEYLTVIEQLEAFNFKYNPVLAEEIITRVLKERGAVKIDGKWQIDAKPIEIKIFIRSDDTVRKSIGEILASKLQKIGFTIKKDFGDLNKAFVVVYGSNPSDLKWSLYTEGWGRSAFVRYDSVGLGQMYSPWFSTMPGFNDPSYWNYKNDRLDTLTQKIYTGGFESSEKRSQLIQEAVVEGVNESVRIFLASKIDQYVVNEKVKGIVNDFGAGVPSRFTPINAQSSNNEFVIGVKQIYQGAWNPVMGLTDMYSRHIWGIISDPATFKHPFTGETFPIRAEWQVETAGPNEKLTVPQEAIIWNPYFQKWDYVTPDTLATSKVTFDYKFSNWHNGQEMDINDILYSLYFTIEWGTQIDENDRTFDTEFTPRTSQIIQTIIGVNPIDEDTIEVYVDYWHFDEGEIADWAVLWNSMPWEISSAMEKAVMDGKVSFSRSGATSKNVNWLSLIIPTDANLIKEYLQEFKNSNYIPAALKENYQNSQYFQNRYDSSIKWIETNNHAVISNGPFYLKSYSPESRTITVSAFDDDSYPFKIGEWAEFEKAKLPIIKNIEMKNIIQRGEELEIRVEVDNSDSILYFLTNTEGRMISSETLNIDGNRITVTVPSENTKDLGIGANNIKIFAISNSVLKPDFYESSFLVTDVKAELPTSLSTNIEFTENKSEYWIWIIPILFFIGVGVYLKKQYL